MKNAFKAMERFSAVIGSDTVCEGNLSSPGAVKVDGILKGNIITSASVYIGESGRVVGNISAIRVYLQGRVDGRIMAEDRVELAGSGCIAGDVVAANFVVCEGATINGSCIVAEQRVKPTELSPMTV